MAVIKVTIKDKQEASALMIMIMALAGIFLMAFGAAYLVFFSVRNSDMKNNYVKARYAAESCLQEFNYKLSSRYFLATATTTDISMLCPLGTRTEIMANDILGNKLSCQVDCDSTGTSSQFIISGRASGAVYRLTKPYISELLASWRMNEHDLSTSDSWDSSGHGYLATANGGVLTSAEVPHPAFVYSLDVSTSTKYLETPNINFTDSQNWSIAFWAYTDSLGSAPYTVLTNINGQATGTLEIITSDAFTATLNIGGVDTVATFTNTGPAMSFYDSWHQFLLAYNGLSLTAYVDGAPFGDSLPYSGDLASDINTMIIGQGFLGKLDEVRLYDRALNSTEAGLLYQHLLLY